MTASKAYLAVKPRNLQRARDKVLEEATKFGEAVSAEDSLNPISTGVQECDVLQDLSQI